MKKTVLCLGLLLSLTLAMSQRQELLFNEDWGYLEDGQLPIEELSNSEDWESVQLPHSWNQWDAVDNSPGYRRDASWYQKKIHIAQPDAHHYQLYFEGANIKTQVYVNGQLAGQHIGGYVGFEIDINKQLVNGENTILVRVDNGYDPQVIPSQKADFFIYGGITRDVWLKKLPLSYISNVRVSTPDVSKKKATTQLAVQLHANHPSNSQKLRVYLQEPESGKKLLQKEIALQPKLQHNLYYENTR